MQSLLVKPLTSPRSTVFKEMPFAKSEMQMHCWEHCKGNFKHALLPTLWCPSHGCCPAGFKETETNTIFRWELKAAASLQPVGRTSRM